MIVHFTYNLQLLFIGLKLAELGVVAHWTWWQVFMPFLAIAAIIATCLFLMALLKLGSWIFLPKPNRRFRQ